MVKIDEIIIGDERMVKRKWQLDFEQLYGGSVDCEHFDNDFYNEMIARLNLKIHWMKVVNYEKNEFLNRHISFSEIEKACK